MATVLLDLAPWPVADASSVSCTDVSMYTYTTIVLYVCTNVYEKIAMNRP